MAATARPDQAAPASAAADTDVHDVVRMAKGAIQEQQERLQRQPSQNMVSPFQSPDAAAHLGANASAAHPGHPSPPRPLQSRPMQQQHQQQQRRKQKATPLWRILCCCARPAVHDDVLEPLGPRNSLPPQLPPSASIMSRVSATSSLQPRFSGLHPKNSTATSFTDADWFDAASDAGWSVHDQELTAGPLMPDPPLYFQDRPLTFTTFPEKLPFAGYWLRDEGRTTPNPQPIDVMLGDKWLVKKVHGSIPGIMLHETPTQLQVRVRPRFLPPGLGRYCEYYNKDGSESTWGMRRDMQPGRSYGRMYMTTCGMLVFRVYTKPMFSDTIDTICEEYMILESRPGQPQQIVARQCCFHTATEKTASQFLVGNYMAEAPKGHSW